jgi:phage portal protein BeeE
MELVDWGTKTLRDLCNIHNVPAELFIENQTYANKNEARKDLVTNNTIPARNSFRDELNRQLLPAFGMEGSHTIDNDYSDLPELQQDLKMMAESLDKMPHLTPNEKRMMMNYEPIDNPNMDKVYIPNNLVCIDDVGLEGFGEDDNLNTAI